MSKPLGQEQLIAVIRDHGISEAMDELSERILRDSKALGAADELASALHDYMVSFVKLGAYEEAPTKRLLIALNEYRELRGVHP